MRGTYILGKVVKVEPFGSEGQNRRVLVRVSEDDAINSKNVQLTVWAPNEDYPADFVSMVDALGTGCECGFYVWVDADSYEDKKKNTRVSVKYTVKGIMNAVEGLQFDVESDGTLVCSGKK